MSKDHGQILEPIPHSQQESTDNHLAEENPKDHCSGMTGEQEPAEEEATPMDQYCETTVEEETIEQRREE